ncbi:MAG: AMP-binding protein [Alphaproteobacteria bacterium]|nr:AMP-binding protein [Alphaproteobacteria bacterium]MBU1575121.1 AMP-binding protein [Alphaproteobacteria bacterium]MBU2076537.1 AMP-binding protein [Alphaproteobacteria bacterium]MBU2160639.1 AMP-binding protein [Alphaproteobacteria bacterium]MBU2245034.1 AMP-binding protein [Alphaproteobacteria bacterium]
MSATEVYLGDRRLRGDTGVDTGANTGADTGANTGADTESDEAAALRRLLTCLNSGQAFRVHPRAPFVLEIAGREAIECCTSGSSGQPKVIRRSRSSWTASFAVNRKLFALAPSDRAAVFGALSHSLTLYGIAESHHCGLGLHLLHRLRPKAQIEQLNRHQISVIYATPTHLRLLSGPPVPSVRVVLCGGGLLDEATRAHVAQMFPRADLRAFYGASETSFVTLTDAQTPPGSVGRAYPGVTLDIRAAQDGVGEVWVQSPYLFDHYVDGESAATQRDEAGMTVGEIGRLDENGYLFLMGRRDRMVTIADRNVHPEALETLLATLLPDRLSAVTTWPDARRGHVLVAYIETGATAPPDDAWLRQEITKALGAIMVPRKIILTAHFPLLASGKPDLAAMTQAPPWP